MAADVPAEVTALADERSAAKADRDFATADRLRDAIRDLGYLVTDGPDGYLLAPRPPFDVLANLGALSALPPVAAEAACAVIVLVDGWPDDVATCLGAVVANTPEDVVVVGVDCGDVDGAGRVLHDLARQAPTRIVDVHLAQPLAQFGWGATVTAALTACGAHIVAVMDLSTIIEGDAFAPILALFSDPDVVGSGWRGVDVDLADNWRSFVDAGPGEVDAILGYLLVVRRQAALAAPPHPKAKFYRNADMEWSLALRESGGRLVVPPGDLPVRQARHHGYHDSDPEYRDRESKRTYDRLLARFRGHDGILRPRA